MSEKTIKYVYRLCPCNPCDVEGIQSWLEDMAAEGLFLIEDGVFCGVFSFERRSPAKVSYRLDVVQRRKPRFPDSGDELMDDELELYHSMGWAYLLRYGDFRVYRSEERDAPELNTESKTHAITIGLLKQKHRFSFMFSFLTALFWTFFAGSSLRYGFRIAASVGVIFLLCVHGVILDVWLTYLLRMFRFRRYEKRLLDGDSLNHRIEWRKKAPLIFAARAVPFLLCFGVAFGLLSALTHGTTEIPHEEYTGEPPFATVADVFPADSIIEDNALWDYGTFKTVETAVAKSVEWNERCDVKTADGENYSCTLRLNYHETASEWVARGLEENYYTYDANRNRRKQFKDLDAPDLGVDSVRVYSSYGSLNVLMREGNRVVRAMVILDNKSDQNQWHVWAQAMAEMLQQQQVA